jgi:hypothetical protein
MPLIGASGLKARLYDLIPVFGRGPLTDTYLQERTSRWEDHRSKRNRDIKYSPSNYLNGTFKLHCIVESLKNMQHQNFPKLKPICCIGFVISIPQNFSGIRMRSSTIHMF